MKISIREMARLLNRNPSTISRELKRNSYKTSINYSVTKYSPIVANKKYKERRKNCHRPTIINGEIKKYIENMEFRTNCNLYKKMSKKYCKCKYNL